jgi:predicted nucleotide-binding protein (sugar kinase/HSP70/actin superfamily)
MIKIGIPRALFYFRYGEFWQHFFRNLGYEIVVSPKTNKQIIEQGLKYVSSEICMPVKIICGHIEVLKNQVDAIFLPRFVEMNHGLYTCPKMIGIVDLARMQVGNSCGILSPKIKDNFMFAHFETGVKLTKNPLRVLRAINKSLPYLTNHKNLTENNHKPTILLLSHFYNLWDDFIGKDIIKAFQDCGFYIKTKEDLPESTLKSDKGFAKNIRWVYERELYNAFQYYSDKVNGICNIIRLWSGFADR